MLALDWRVATADRLLTAKFVVKFDLFLLFDKILQLILWTIKRICILFFVFFISSIISNKQRFFFILFIKPRKNLEIIVYLLTLSSDF